MKIPLGLDIEGIKVEYDGVRISWKFIRHCLEMETDTLEP